ncbi:RNA binding protein rbp16 [Lotmaria passim]
MFRASIISRIAPSLVLLNTGKVVSWMSGRGFGFIEDDADKKQHFVHFSALQTEPGGYRAVSVGQEVEFEVATQDGRTRAENVTGPGGAKLPSGPRPPEGAGGRGGFGGRGRGRGGNRNYNNNNRQDRGDNNHDAGRSNNNFSDEF